MTLQRFWLCRSRSRAHRFYPWYALWDDADLTRVSGLWTRTKEGLEAALLNRFTATRP